MTDETRLQPSERAAVAELWYECAQLRRTDIFGPVDELRPEYERRNLQWQVDVPVFGIVGAHYGRDGVVILSVNPAGGKRSFESSYLDDQVYERCRELRDLKPGSSRREAFEAMNSAYRSAMLQPHWTITRKHYVKILKALGKQVDEISFLQMVPFRTRDDNGSGMRPEYIVSGYERSLKRQLTLLAPGVVIAMDTPSRNIAQLHKMECSPETTVCYWTRRRNVSDAERFDSLRACLDGRE